MMRTGIMIVMLMASLFKITDGADKQFRVQETWSHDLEITGRIGDSIVLKGGNLVTSFYKMGPVFMGMHAAKMVCVRGQGPDELQDLFAICAHPLGPAFVELPFRIKIFSREKGENFRCQRSVWLEKSRFYTAVSAALFFRGRWFLAGYFLENFSRKNVFKKVFVKIYNAEGKYLKGLIRKTDHEPDQRHLMDYYLVEGGGRVYFLVEDRMRVTVIDPDSLEVMETADLDPPEAYLSMPKEFYVFKRYDDPYSGIERDMDTWRTGYSRIVSAAYDQGVLILQIRVFEPSAHYMVLFYNSHTFQPAGRVLTNDRLLGVREGRFYFYAGGDPRYEDEADRSRIKVCTLENKSK